MRSPRLVSIAALLVGLAAAACGDKVQSGLTGLDIRVSFDENVDVYKLRFSGWLGGEAAFGQVDRPDDDRPLSPGGEDLVVLLPDRMVGQTVFVQVDGIDRGGTALASAGASVEVQRRQLASVELPLGEPRFCGDGAVHPTAEQCDDRDSVPGDGCTSECVIEEEWTCQGEPSLCWKCGDGLCTAGGEDACTCPGDCPGAATCGDGLCCRDAGEVCSCPADCEVTCGDDICCDSELSCQEDCGSCGDGTCDSGEDVCRCPEDCQPDDNHCGNGSCCAADGEDVMSCQQDCCQDPQCGDGVCCPDENATSCSDDCCDANVCNDGVCCPGETIDMCPADCCGDTPNCGDGTCCPGLESQESCPQDCCSSVCGDGRCCPGEDCPSDGCVVCPACQDTGPCSVCCDSCTEGSCEFSCRNSCTCVFDCRESDVTACSATCGNSGCVLECHDAITCTLDCTQGQGDGCICRGSTCQLNCPRGAPILCDPEAERPTYVCSQETCP